MTQHFEKLRENSQKRMSRLEDALKKATRYEDQSDQFDKWLRDAEGQKVALGSYPIISQPLRAQLEKMQVSQ